MFENMSARERVLAISVLSLLPIFLLFFGFLWFMDLYEGNASNIDQLSSQLEAEEDKTHRGMLASQRQNYYRKVSLPANTNRVRSIYRNWLDDLIIKKAGMTHFGVKFKDNTGALIHEQDTIAKREIFTARPKGTLPQLITFLHAFYSADHLHRINKLSIKPLTTVKRGKAPVLTKDLQIEMEIETLSMVDARESIESFPVYNRQLESIDNYSGRILARNIFGPANNPPSLEKPRTLKFTVAKESDNVTGKFVTVQVSVDDIDKDDLHVFELLRDEGEATTKVVLGDQPRSPSIRRISVKVPKQKTPTTIPISLKVRDSGLPAKEDTLKFAVVFNPAPVAKPPKQKPPEPEPIPVEFAKHTFVRGIVKGKDGRWVAWIVQQLKAQNMQKLGVGDSIEMDDVTWKVVSVDAKAVTFEVDGEQLSFVTGSSLAEPLSL